MSKRRSRKSNSQPNLPPDLLERARREAGLEDNRAEEARETAAEPVRARPTVSSARSEPLPPAQPRRKRRREKELDVSQLTHEEIAERLANPTRTVTTEELRAQYAHVIADLRSMGLLAGALFIIMILVAQFL